MKKHLATLAFTILLGTAAQSVRASVVISNLDPANPTYGFNSPTIGQAALIGNRPISLTSVQLLQTAGPLAGETFSVYSRNADGTVGSSLFSAFALSFDSTSKVETASVNGTFTLQANTGYFFVLSSGSNTSIEWSCTLSTDYAAAFGTSLPVTRTAFGRAGSTTTYYDLSSGPQLFQINGSALPAVPEPSTYAFMGLACAGGVVLLARRRAVGTV